MHWVNNSIKLLSLGKIQTWFICSLATWISTSTWQYLLCSFYGWMRSSAISFFSVLWWRGVSKLKLICYQLRGEFWKDSTAWDFLFNVQVIEKVQKKAQFSFCRQMKAFHYEIVLLGIQPSFLHGGPLGLLWNATKAATFWSILRYIFTLWSRKSRF